MSQDLKSLIKSQVTSSMKNGDKLRTSVLRMTLAEIQKEEISEKSDLGENKVISILEKMIKQRKDSIDQYLKASRNELADKEKEEITIIQEFLPDQMTEEEIKEIIQKTIESTGAESMKDMGKVMSALKEQTAGKADAAVISQEVKKILA
mgnify:FL=1|tara:strand:+ start:6 stop:455 length:450 start_codon:yes stop_codon:yes gene_type:complete